MPTTLLIAGASGFVGAAVLRQALSMEAYSTVICLVRRPSGVKHAKLVEWLGGESDLLTGLRAEQVDAVICCLGTTIRTVGGDRQKFIHVDKDLVLGLGRWAQGLGVRAFAVVSAMGADPESRIFYNRVKGEMEAGLRSIGLPRLAIFQPSILTGGRTEFRLLERISIGAMKAFAPFMRGSLVDYRPMPNDVLARAMINTSLAERPLGESVLRYDAIVAASHI